MQGWVNRSTSTKQAGYLNLAFGPAQLTGSKVGTVSSQAPSFVPTWSTIGSPGAQAPVGVGAYFLGEIPVTNHSVTTDKTTLRGMIETIRIRDGTAERISVMDRDIPAEDVLAEIRAGALSGSNTPLPSNRSLSLRAESPMLISMILTGISDEAGNTLEAQIAAIQALGWQHIEMRGVEVTGFKKANFHDIPEAAFDLALQKLTDSQIQVYCFGSTIMNWAKRIHEPPFSVTLDEVQRCIPRMQKAGSRFVRIMSFKPDDEESSIPQEVFHRMREVTRMFLDVGIQPVHENCMNYGGMSSRHALQLLEEVPGLKWVFDTANPIFNADRSQAKPWPKQDPWEFWTQVRDVTAHIHVKDATWNPAKNDADYRWPGEGDGRVLDILRDAISRGYNAGISIEPHMVVVFHDAQSKSDDTAIQKNFIEYGRRLEALIQTASARGGS